MPSVDPPSPPALAETAAMLLELAELDLRTRQELVRSGELFQGYHPRMGRCRAGRSATARSATGTSTGSSGRARRWTSPRPWTSAGLGLPPLAQAVAARRRATAAERQRPADLAARRREMQAWARRVGWRD
ncbi:MAG: hypothetical protein H6712_14145 [Myxococcales bacterium]|nr:hypothetical protein [Myxococcales bacterium]MCB9715003.1 hypothetical protein [Myxococcales bacterium]